MRRKLAPPAVVALLVTAGALAGAAPAQAVGCSGLQDALTNAPAGSVVAVEEDCSGMSFDLPPRPITVEGAGDGAVLDGGAPGDRVLTGVDVGETVLRNLALTNSTAASGEGGGALKLTGDSAITLDGVSFEDNSAPGGAGGGALIESSSSSPTVISASTFSGNTAGVEGGGLALSPCSGPLRLENVVVAGNNTAGGGAGSGVSVAGCDATILHTTVSGNEADAGSALHGGAGSSLSLRNSIVAGNSGGADLTGFPVALSVRYSDACAPGVPVGTGNICRDPLLVAPGPGSADVRQTQFSPTVDHGSAAYTSVELLTDFEGDPRKAGPVVDMGADEFTAPLALTSSSRSARPTRVTLTAAVNPHTHATVYTFEYGATSEYGSSTPSGTLAAGNSIKAVSSEVSGLTPGRTYHFRVVATNSAGSSVGLDKTFRTDPDTFKGVAIQPGSVRVKDRTAAVLVTCPRGSLTTCAGSLRLATTGKVLVRASDEKRRRVTLGSAGFSIPVRSSALVRVKLSGDGRRALRLNGSLRTNARATATNGFTTRTRRATLTLKGKKRSEGSR